jgi:hypothetical protein
LQLTVASIADMMLILDSTDRVVFINPVFSEITAAGT